MPVPAHERAGRAPRLLREPISFDRVVCGLDWTPAGAGALRQAARLASPGARLVVVSVLESPSELLEGGPWLAWGADPQAALDHALAGSSEPSQIVELRLHAPATVIAALVAVARRAEASLLAVGAGSSGRLAAFFLGTPPAALLRRAPCSVLVARAASDGPHFPARVVVGIDGSAEGEAAATVAADLGERFGADVRRLPAGDREATRALLDASRGADLVVVGRRPASSLTRRSAGGRVASRARCSVLVVDHA